MTGERCERTDLLATQCAHCLGHTDPIADALAAEAPHAYAVDVDNQPRAIATFSSRCPVCSEHIQPGDEIVGIATPEQSLQSWACAGCGP